MGQKFRSLLDELDTLLPEGHKTRVIESKGDHLITAASNFIRLLNENFDQDTALDLQKRFLLAIKAQDPSKFKRGLPKDAK